MSPNRSLEMVGYAQLQESTVSELARGGGDIGMDDEDESEDEKQT